MSYYDKITIVKALIAERESVTQREISEVICELEAIERSLKTWPVAFCWRKNWWK